MSSRSAFRVWTISSGEPPTIRWRNFVAMASSSAAVRAFWTDTHNLAEGAGAAGLAAVLAEPGRLRGRCAGTVLCGGNIDLALFRDWVVGGA